MEDLITLKCPNCGGKLYISPNTTTLICQYCGVEHLVRWQDSSAILESFARCPQCNRNDRVQKISAILVTKTNTILAQKLSPPKTPNLPTEPNYVEREYPGENYLVPAIIGFLIVGFILIVAGYNSACILSPFAAILVAITIYSLVQRSKGSTLRDKDFENFNRELDNWENLSKNHDNEVINWNHIINLWNQLYYCERDDCVFLPGKQTHSPSSDMMQYLQSN